MKMIVLLMRFGLLSLLLCCGISQSEGFATGTLVATKSSFVSIEQLCNSDVVTALDKQGRIGEFSVVNTTDYITDWYIKIDISGETICVAPDQKFYSFDKHAWIFARSS